MLRRGVREYLKLRPRTRVEVAQEVDEEIELHLQLRVEHLESLGLPREAARAEAVRRFGEVERARTGLRQIAEERERSMSIGEWLSGWGQDFRYGARALRRELLPSLVIVLTLGLGIGANVVMFGIVDELLLQGPAHVANPEQVRRLYLTTGAGAAENTTSYTAFVAYTALKGRTEIVEDAASYRTGLARIGNGQDAMEVTAGWSTHELFPLLGVQPALGRFYTEAEARPRQPHHVVVIDHGYWQSAMGGRPDVVGQKLQLDGTMYEIIGVAPERFTGAERSPVALWLPLSTSYEPHPEWPTSWNAQWLNVIARLRPGASMERVAAEVTGAVRGTAGNNTEIAEARAALLPLGFSGSGAEPPEYAVSRWLIGVSVVVLLVAAANVMNLLLGRGMRRRRELAVRTAMGISRTRMIRLLLSESLLLSLAGGAVATVLAYWGGRFMRATLLPDVQWASPLNTRVLLVTLAVILLTGIVVGVAPALQAGRLSLTDALKAGTGGSGSRRSWLRDGLTVMQAALSLVLLIGAGLFVRSLWNVQQVDLGIDAHRVVAVWPTFPVTAQWGSPEWDAQKAGQARMLAAAVDRLRQNPEVAGAALALGIPMQGSMGVDLVVPGLDSLPKLPGGGPYIVAAGPGYFEAVGTSILRGRGVEPGEGKGTEPVVVVSETMARTLWPNEDAFTKCVYVGGGDAPCSRVVGIAEDTKRRGIDDEAFMQYYVPLGQERGVSGTQLIVSPRGDAREFEPQLRRELHAALPAAEYFNITLLQERIDPQIRPWRLGATMFLVFGALALLIAAIGLYSVVSYGVAQRRTEIGVRMALGARAGGIVQMILRQGVGLVLLGIALGVPLALAGGRMLEAQLFNTSARDVATFTVVAALLTVVAVCASVIPAARAARTSPLEALRID